MPRMLPRRTGREVEAGPAILDEAAKHAAPEIDTEPIEEQACADQDDDPVVKPPNRQGIEPGACINP